MKPIQIERCRSDVSLPFYAHEGDSGMDVRAAEDILLKPGETALVPTGLKIYLPKGFEIQVRPRSGLSLNTPLRLPNAPGTIDSGFRDELHIILWNASQVDLCQTAEILTLESKGQQHGTYQIRKGDRIAQLVFATITTVELEEIDAAQNHAYDRGGGFGHSGVR